MHIITYASAVWRIIVLSEYSNVRSLAEGNLQLYQILLRCCQVIESKHVISEGVGVFQLHDPPRLLQIHLHRMHWNTGGTLIWYHEPDLLYTFNQNGCAIMLWLVPNCYHFNNLSTANLLSPYAIIELCEWSSAIGIFSGSPNIPAVEDNMKYYRTSSACLAIRGTVKGLTLISCFIIWLKSFCVPLTWCLSTLTVVLRNLSLTEGQRNAIQVVESEPQRRSCRRWFFVFVEVEARWRSEWDNGVRWRVNKPSGDWIKAVLCGAKGWLERSTYRTTDQHQLTLHWCSVTYNPQMKILPVASPLFVPILLV